MLGRRFACFVVLGLLGPAVATRGADADQYIPSDTQLVVTLNVKQMLESGVVKPDLGRLQAAMKGVDGLQKALEGLGFDPMKDLDRVSMVHAGAEDPEKGLIIVSGKFDTAKFKAVAEAEATKGKGLTAVKAGEYTLYEIDNPGQPQPFFAGLIDGTTVVASPRKEVVAEAFDIKAGKKKHTVKKELTAVMAKNDPKQSVSVAALGSALPNIVPSSDKVKSIHGGIHLGDDIQTNIIIETADNAAAKDLAAAISEGLEQGKNAAQLIGQIRYLAPAIELVNNLKVKEMGANITLSGTVSKEMLEKLKKDF
jgi:hypothetical protein